MASLLDPHACRVVRARDEHGSSARRDRRQSVFERERVVRPRRHEHDAAADGLDGDRVHVEGRQDHDALGVAIGGATLLPDHGGQQDALVQAVGEQQRRLGHAEVLRRLAIHGVVVRIERDVVAAERAQRLDHLRRAPGGVLVQVQPQGARGGDWVLIRLAHTPLTIMDCACAVSPSASARARTVGPSALSPAAVTRWTETTRTKSAACKPTAKARGAAGRQHVVRPDGVVARHLRGVPADEDRTGARDRRRRRLVVDDQVLGRHPVGQRHGLGSACA